MFFFFNTNVAFMWEFSSSHFKGSIEQVLRVHFFTIGFASCCRALLDFDSVLAYFVAHGGCSAVGNHSQGATAGLLHHGATSARYLRRWQHVDHIIAFSGEKFFFRVE